MEQHSKRETAGVPADITVIEDPAMVARDEEGNALARDEFIDSYTIRAHPLIVDALLEDEETEQVWTMNQILDSLG